MPFLGFCVLCTGCGKVYFICYECEVRHEASHMVSCVNSLPRWCTIPFFCVFVLMASSSLSNTFNMHNLSELKGILPTTFLPETAEKILMNTEFIHFTSRLVL